MAVRSAVFVLFEQAHFDSDQATVGLMASHIAQRQAFPVFFYGQTYILAVEAWLAAPVLLLAGPSVVALKLPIAALNLVAAGLLVWLLVRDGDLDPISAFAAALVFVAAPPVAASRLVEAAGANIEPFVYVLLLWLLRDRPLSFGAVLGIGFLNREFTMYGALAVVLVGLADGSLRSRDGVNRIVRAAVVFAIVLAVVSGLSRFMSNDAAVRPPSLADVRLDAMPGRVQTLVGVMLPILFGVREDPLQRFNIGSRLVVGHAWLGWMLVVTGVAVLVRLVYLPRQRHPVMEAGFPLYLTLVGLQSAAAFLLLPAGGDDMQVRYVLLALLLPVGLVAAFLAHEPRTSFRAAVLAAVVIWAAVGLGDHVRLIHEYQTRRPPNPYRDLAVYLTESGVRYARASYWVAYHLTFLTGERVIVDSTDVVRIPAYRDLVGRHRDEAVDLGSGDAPCASPTRIRQWYICRP